MATPYAFVTLVSSDSYLPGALTLAAALKDVHLTPAVAPEVEFQSVCLVTPETVDVSTIKLLRRAFDIVIGVEVITQQDETRLALLGRLDLNTVLTKLHVFRLTQFSKIIFLDADVLPIRPLSHLFTLPYEFSAAPDVGWPDIFNSGVMVLSPGEDKFAELTGLLRSKGSWDGGDQGILNEWRGGNWNRLSFTYNTTPTAAYTYAPAYERFGSQISAIHFIGPDKPWNSLPYRSPFSSHSIPTSDSRQQAYDYNSLVDRWYDVYDRHYRSQAISHQPQFEINRYESAWNKQSGGGKTAAVSVPGDNTFSLEELRRLAVEGMNAASRDPYCDKPGDNKLLEGQYQSMPLEGRLDLMRPTKSLQTRDQGVATEEEFRQTVEAKERKRPEILDVSIEEEPRTPTARHAGLPGDYPPRWRTLPTPGPNEVPPSPRPQPIPLPSATPSTGYGPGPSQVPSEPESPSHRPPEPRPREVALVEQQSMLLPSQNKAAPQTERRIPPRPHSPTMLLWNPAVEPPPTETPLASAFPADTYFPNAWDPSPSKSPHQPYSPHTPVPHSGVLFEPLPQPEIPESLIRQGYYRNVTGEDQKGATPSPDRTKIKHVFPWEEKPRHLPGRVFPAADIPKPALFLSPESQASQTSSSSEIPTTPETKPSLPPPVLSPLYGLPSSFTYPNAWDNIPSIQQYASKLTRPPAPRPLEPAFDGAGWDERAEASSRDGDVESEGDESADERVAGQSLWTYGRVPKSAKALQRSKRGSSVPGTRESAESRARYRDFGVQTIPREMREQGVQTTTTAAPVKLDRRSSSADTENELTPSSPGQWAPSGRQNVPPLAARHDGNGRGVSTASAIPSPGSEPQRRSPPIRATVQPPSPSTHVRSPLAASPSLSGSRPSKITTSPLKSSVHPSPHSPATHSASIVTRQPSNESSLGSPASSIGPVSPADGQAVPSPQRKGGRVWDPARGVDLFKRGSEEVLARFLKMGSWDDEKH
ncbi:putative glycosyltransferase family 8 protein [Lyophyllum shimeji]|uniref:glycogenin glucosyltransferase n=1 Tax=Lyophyllum shimeji TaxID=47721 RepID=A0A9P3PI75_LYOSH|nr:putative glycosyltransferase family 8 protein [Lyophyllum shimeji]